MAEEDDFDIDIYGDDKPDLVDEPADQPKAEQKQAEVEVHLKEEQIFDEPETEPFIEPPAVEDGAGTEQMDSISHDIAQAPPEQSHASQPITAGEAELAMDGVESTPWQADPGATTALKLLEVQWWTTEDDIRGWANQAGVEDEITEITFNEHKVNGKSKGEVFIGLSSPEAATGVKHTIANANSKEHQTQKINILYTQPEPNPFKTYPKDAQNRIQNNFKDRQQGSYNNQSNHNNSGGYRGRGGYNNRGGYNQNRGGFNNNQMGMMGNYGGMNNMGNMGMGGYGGGMGFNRGGGGGMMGRGGFQGNRGRGGGMMGGNMGMMPNMGMGMGGMGMGMGMDMMNMGFGGGFPQGQFNQYSGSQSPPASNPHGAKRPRPE